MNSTIATAFSPDAAVDAGGFPTTTALGATLAVGLVSILIAGWPRKAKDLPPGPAPGFFVGHRNQGPPSKPWVWFQELNEQYGQSRAPRLAAELSRAPAEQNTRQGGSIGDIRC